MVRVLAASGGLGAPSAYPLYRRGALCTNAGYFDRAYLPFDPTYVRNNLSNFSAVSYTMKQMRTRLLKHIKGGGKDQEAEREALESAAIAFFSHLEERGWRLVRTQMPAASHSTGVRQA